MTMAPEPKVSVIVPTCDRLLYYGKPFPASGHSKAHLLRDEFGALYLKAPRRDPSAARVGLG